MNIGYYIIIAHAPIEYRNLLLPRYIVVINCDIQFGESVCNNYFIIIYKENT